MAADHVGFSWLIQRVRTVCPQTPGPGGEAEGTMTMWGQKTGVGQRRASARGPANQSGAPRVAAAPLPAAGWFCCEARALRDGGGGVSPGAAAGRPVCTSGVRGDLRRLRLPDSSVRARAASLGSVGGGGPHAGTRSPPHPHGPAPSPDRRLSSRPVSCLLMFSLEEGRDDLGV